MDGGRIGLRERPESDNRCVADCECHGTWRSENSLFLPEGVLSNATVYSRLAVSIERPRHVLIAAG